MRLSFFPPGADRPWRTIILYVAHSVWTQIRSPWFWVTACTLPLVMVGSLWLRMGDTDGHKKKPPPLLVVVPDAGLREAFAWLEERESVRLVAAAEDGDNAGTLTLEGASMAELVPHLHVPPERNREELEDRARSIVRAAWLRTYVPMDVVQRVRAGMPAEKLPTDAATSEVATVKQIREILAGVGGMGLLGTLMLAVMIGNGIGTGVNQSRDKGLFAVLRVGTSAEVLFVAAVLEAFFLSLVTFAWLVIPAALVMVAGLVSLLASAALSAWMVEFAALWALAFGGACAFALAFNTVAGALQRGQPSAGVVGQLPFLAFIFGLPMLMRGEALLRMPAFAALPWVGMAASLPDLAAGTVTGWGVIGWIGSVLFGLAALRVGAWAYALESITLADLRPRAVRRIR